MKGHEDGGNSLLFVFLRVHSMDRQPPSRKLWIKNQPRFRDQSSFVYGPWSLVLGLLSMSCKLILTLSFDIRSTVRCYPDRVSMRLEMVYASSGPIYCVPAPVPM